MALLMGSVLGFLTGLGVGGGSLLILWLTLGLGMDQETATGINLLFFIPTALISSLFRIKQRHLNWQHILPPLTAAAVSAILFSFIADQLDTTLLRKPFGILLAVTGARELFYRRKKVK